MIDAWVPAHHHPLPMRYPFEHRWRWASIPETDFYALRLLGLLVWSCQRVPEGEWWVPTRGWEQAYALLHGSEP